MALNHSEKYDRVSRRAFLKAGVAAVCGLAFTGTLAESSMAGEARTGNVPLDERPERAADGFGSMSCAEALASAYGDLVGLSAEQAKNLAGGFGLGMGRKGACGAVTVMLMIAGLAGRKSECRSLMDSFEKDTGSIMCADYVDSFGYGKCRDLLRCSSRLLNEKVFA